MSPTRTVGRKILDPNVWLFGLNGIICQYNAQLAAKQKRKRGSTVVNDQVGKPTYSILRTK